MARKVNARVILNRQAADKVRLAIGDGTQAVGRAIFDTADAPDAAPFGEGLVEGGVITFVDGKKTVGWGEDGRQPRKPRTLRTPKDAIVTAVGWAFPARFQEFGTAHHAAQPFAAPARDAVEPRAPGIVRQAAAYRIASLRR